MNDFDKIICRYLDNELDDREKRAFEQRLAEEEDLKKEFEFQRDLKESLMEDEVMQLRDKLNQITSEERTFRTFSVKHVVLYAAAAVVITIVSMGTWLYVNQLSKSPEELYTEYYNAYENIYSKRSGENIDEDNYSLIENAMGAYEQKDWEKAEKYFGLLLERESNDVFVNFYAGIVYLEQQKGQEAIETFETVTDDKENLFREQAYWYTALAYLQKEDIDSAREYLEKIVDEEMTKIDEARKLLRTLKYKQVLT
ncbi:MAG: tetratricopeptide repeat protein [Bacteroidales bacterium]